MFQEVDIEPWNDVTPAAWIRPRLRPFMDFTAGSVVPVGFAKYARIDNENYGRLGEDAGRALIDVLVRHKSASEVLWLSWCVATEIDLPWTYVGGAEAVIEDILDDPRLAAAPLSLDESTAAQDHPELGQPT